MRRASRDSTQSIPIDPVSSRSGFCRSWDDPESALPPMKSQLVIEYAYQIHEREPETWIFWIYASNAARFEQSYWKIADTVKLFGRQNPKANICRLLYNWLQDSTNGKWILILDNVDDAHFLLDRHDDDVRGPADVIELAAALDFIPLAIVQAAVYISDSERDCSVRQYLDEFRRSDRKKVRLLGRGEGQLRRDWEARNSVLTTWQISRRSVADLLSLVSFFDRQGIPEAPLKSRSEQRHVEPSHSDDDGGDDDDSESQSSVTDEFKDDILILRRYSLISTNADQRTFSMHGLVQLAVRRWLEMNGELEKWKQQYIRNLNAEFPTGEFENWAQCQILFPHAKAAASQRPHERDSLMEWAAVLYKAAWYDMRKGNGAEGRACPEHEDTLDSVEMGRWKAAEELEVQVIETRKKVLGAEHPDALASMANLAETYRSQGQWNEAEKLEVQVLDTRKKCARLRAKNLGTTHRDTLSSNDALTEWQKIEHHKSSSPGKGRRREALKRVLSFK
ncbi:hypothetical protein TSTA_056240 [Talaromyces stipitatus ATCC 10500]|uniref:DUF7779 domain-containing protein n=1 Tax=Talaromyces stipitatus (strain ATCC 10500 / CBS 375.48 / QM 6759 / NRRL 1006) TaxID=441959 RepID=B8MRI8_TALSN|nr:uncharacterized protein TSTA_056240 [Talaromyces stipitatus ATCC 10500]EED13125.1 hypothetical protein TSTA_056240 [Talaromyces stipitatus ATCC 10500]